MPPSSLQPIKCIREAEARGGGRQGAEASGTHAPLADPLPRRSAGNLRNEIGSSSVSAISPSNSLSYPSPHRFTGLVSAVRSSARGTGGRRKTEDVCVAFYLPHIRRFFLSRHSSVFRRYPGAIMWTGMVLSDVIKQISPGRSMDVLPKKNATV